LGAVEDADRGSGGFGHSLPFRQRSEWLPPRSCSLA
jgi:hypothetical protein